MTRSPLAPLTHQPALDGIRGIAILAVLVFHLGYVQAGFLGVDLFFVLSGFLITRLLLAKVAGTGHVGLSSFWVGRLRRLLPAALVTIAAIAVLAIVGVFSSPSLRADLGGALGYVANWRLVLSGDDYADQFGPASPVRHFWSLAVEEQFYLVWPLVLAGAAVAARRRGWSVARIVFVIAVVLSTLSAVLLWRLYDPSAISRAYYGTDARMFGPLIGAALAVVTARRPGTRRAWRPLELGAFVLLVGAGLAVIRTWTVTTEAYYHGGAVLFALGCAAIIGLALVRPMVPLAWRPLCWVGTISYGLDLYHWPIFAVLSPERTGWSGAALAVVRLAVTFALAAASAVWLEQPIRAGRMPKRVAPAALAGALTIAIVAVVAVPVPEPLVDLTEIDLTAAPPSPPPPRPSTSVAPAPTTISEIAAQPASAPIGPTSFSIDPSAPPVGGDAPATPPSTVAAPPTTPATEPPPAALRIMVIGDSVGNNIGGGLERWSAGRSDVVVWNRANVGCGFELHAEIILDTPPNPGRCQPWIDQFPSFADSFEPDVVLVVVGRGDMALRQMPEWGGTRRVGDPEFNDLIGTAYDDALGRLERPGTTVAIATYPCLDEVWVYHDEPGPDGRRANETTAAFNDFLRGLGRPIVELDAHVCPGGQYSSVVEGITGARPDGFHFSPEAADALAPWLVGQVRPLR
jgi:peptidoglycan/LPS O-acetylase OafA/YrhL